MRGDWNYEQMPRIPLTTDTHPHRDDENFRPPCKNSPGHLGYLMKFGLGDKIFWEVGSDDGVYFSRRWLADELNESSEKVREVDLVDIVPIVFASVLAKYNKRH